VIITPPTLPYDFADLEPAMSADTLVFHFSQHQRGDFAQTAALIRGTELDRLPLEEVVRTTARTPGGPMIYQRAAEVWNHNFFWKSMRPAGGGAARGLIAECIDAHFGNYEAFVREFKNAAAALFGNGWLWVTLKDEHAYYLGHQNRRSAYVATFLDELVDWDCANRILRRRMGVTDTLAGRLRAEDTEADRMRRASAWAHPRRLQ
jgi:superoxide dismutase, Fe-Mn family